MKAEELDALFDSGEDISEHLDLSTAKKIGVTRQSIIKVWIAERLKAEQTHKAS